MIEGQKKYPGKYAIKNANAQRLKWWIENLPKPEDDRERHLMDLIQAAHIENS